MDKEGCLKCESTRGQQPIFCSALGRAGVRVVLVVYMSTNKDHNEADGTYPCVYA
jgi:hypothetical protein